ncbi:hypothetical protein [Nitratifractor salsuginis]|uniref:Uncharacterized protein n=1 Tax=Nitratifractor salsuginis (strain DSM 16511 / JCM 12458 / E9I37-1) TaxID=749222 RepID=E6X1M1_NITSE|nr:hypothetical protein [Nitratifractor salsuginis]ADV47012.1 hypothetical protein Nitsa_1767 [Nitratifractor salsuginis DSM 16511]
MTSVVNQFGRYLDGRHRDEIIAAWQKGESAVVIEGVRLDIVSSDRDAAGNLVIRVEVCL